MRLHCVDVCDACGTYFESVAAVAELDLILLAAAAAAAATAPPITDDPVETLYGVVRLVLLALGRLMMTLR